MSKINGPFEAAGLVVGLAIGSYVGYTIGSEAVEYAKKITEDPDLLRYVVSQHPTLTKLYTTLGVGSLSAQIGRVPGTLVDMVTGKYNQNWKL